MELGGGGEWSRADRKPGDLGVLGNLRMVGVINRD